MVTARLPQLAALGVDVEIYFDNETIDGVTERDVGEIGRMLRDAGVGCTVHAPFMDLSPGGVDRAVRAITREKLTKAAAMANILQARGMVCHPGYNKWFFDKRLQLWLDSSADTWDAVLKEADRDLPVMIENIFEEEPSTLLELLARFQGRNLAFCFDSGHFNLFSKVSMEAWLVPFRDRIGEMHLHDNHGVWDEHLPVGEGTFPFRELKSFVKTLHNVIYTTEIHDESRVPEGIRNLKEFLS